MKDFLFVWIFPLAFLGLLGWGCHSVVKKFGWQGLLIKIALVIVGCFLTFVIGFHETPWTAARLHYAPLNDSSYAALLVSWVVWGYFLISDRAMRWLMKPLVKWILCSAAALWLFAFYAALKGWL